MNYEFKKIFAALLATALSLSLLSGCSSPKTSGRAENSDSKAGQEETAQQASSGVSKEFDLPAMGLTVTLPDALVEKMNQGLVTMFTNEVPVADNSALEYGYLSWSTADGTQQDAEKTNPYEINMDAMQNVGTLGVYLADIVGSLDDLTNCDKHQEIGQSADGAYKYYLSVNTSADEELVKEIQEIKAEITEMADYGQANSGAGRQPTSSVSTVGEFSTQDVNGNTVTQDIFKEHKLTMVNVFTTWCSPCVQEMPDLEKLYQQMKDRNVGVVGVVLDVLDEKGEIVEKDLEQAQLLVQKTGVTYPVILPDSTYLNGRLMSIEAFPESFFVDQNGNIVGETYSGSGSLEDWLGTVEKELANLEAGT